MIWFQRQVWRPGKANTRDRGSPVTLAVRRLATAGGLTRVSLREIPVRFSARPLNLRWVRIISR